MITKLTNDQKVKVQEYYDRYFEQAISTKPADRKKAEEAARSLVELGGVKIEEIIWVGNPKEGEEKFNSLSVSFSKSLREYLGESLGGSLSDSLWAYLWGSLSESLWESLWDSLRDSLSEFLSESLWDSLWDLGFMAFCMFCIRELGIEVKEEDKKRFYLLNDLLASCFALWVVPGTIILCERPKRVEVQDGKLVDIEW